MDTFFLLPLSNLTIALTILLLYFLWKSKCKAGDNRLFLLVLFAFYIFGIVFKGIYLQLSSDEIMNFANSFGVKELIPSSELVYYYGTIFTSIFFILFLFFFFKFGAGVKAGLFRRYRKHIFPHRKSFYLATFLFAFISFSALIISIGFDSIFSNISAKRFSDSFSITTYISLKLCFFSRIFYLFGRTIKSKEYQPIKILNSFHAFVVIASSIIVSNRVYLLLFLVEMIIIEFISDDNKLNRLKTRLLKVRTSISRKKSLIKNSIFLIGIVIVLLYITATRASSHEDFAFSELLQFSLIKIFSGRYLFDVIKLGEIYNYVIETPKSITLFTLGWLLPGFVSGYKELGPLLAEEVYGISDSGVTPGLFSELAYDFGILPCFILIPVVCYFYWLLIRAGKLFIPNSGLLIYWIISISKSIVIINSSFGAAIFSILLDIFAILVSDSIYKLRFLK